MRKSRLQLEEEREFPTEEEALADIREVLFAHFTGDSTAEYSALLGVPYRADATADAGSLAGAVMAIIGPSIRKAPMPG
jgi:hypothetical protein